MTIIKILSAGLIAVAMVATPAVAHENSVAEQYVVLKGNAGAAFSTRRIYGHARITAPHVGGLGTSAHDEPGGVCDHGDNPMIC